MDKKEKLAMLQKLDERKLTKEFLIPLFENLGCKNIEYTHKPLEFGKDIIYYKEDEFERRIYTGVQVKKVKIATSEITTIFRQICEAFGEQFNDSSDNKKKSLDRFIVLTSNDFTEDAKQSLSASLRGDNKDKIVTYIDGNKLIDLLDKHLPSAFWDEYDYFTKYFNALKDDFEKIKDVSAIGQKEPVPLESIYVSLKVHEKIDRPELPIEKEEKIFEEKFDNRKKEKLSRRELDKETKRERVIDVEKAIKDYQKLVIVGVPGSGKTTLLKHLALKSCKDNIEKQERACVPIFFTLQGFLKSGKSLREYIDEVFDKYEFPKAKAHIEKDLKWKKCRLLLDGFDELATRESQEKVTEEILKFNSKYPNVQVIVTSRIAGYHDELKGFTKLELMEFDDKQIKEFIENWFGKIDAGKAKSMYDAIKENEKIKTLARNPLMIAIIAVIYDEDKKLPQKRAALYERCVEVLLSRWDVQKKVKNVYPSDKKEFILRKLAFYGHTNNRRVLSEKEVMSEMLKHFPRLQLKEEDAKPFLDEIWQRSYLLRQISRDSYDFLHLSFQEYFTALELKEQEDGISKILEHINEPWWEEPALLYAGISKDATALIKRINRNKEDIFYSNLMLSGKCIADADFTEPALRDTIVKDLWSLYENTKFEVLKTRAIHVLSLIRPDNLISSLIKKLEDKESDVRGSAAYALGQIGSEKSVEPLIEALTKSKESDVRGSAASALGQIGSEKSVEPLKKALKDESSYLGEEVRDKAFTSLEEISRKLQIRITLD